METTPIEPGAAGLASLTWEPVLAYSRGGNFGIVRGTIWLRHRLVASEAAAGEWRLRLRNPRADAVDVWIVEGAQWQGPQSSGLVSLAAGQPGAHRQPTATIILKAGQPVEVIVRVRSSGWLQVPLTLTPSELRDRQDQIDYLGLGLCLGVLGGLLGYNAFLAISLRDGAYASYVAMTACRGWFWLASTGAGAQLLWSPWSAATPWMLNASSMLGSFFALEFTQRFLALKDTMPRVHRATRALQIAWIIALLLHVRWAPDDLVRYVTTPIALGTTLLIAICGIAGLVRRAPGATPFCIAWAGLLLSAVIVTLTRGGLVGYWPNADAIAMAGSSVELILFSLALGHRFASEKRARARAEGLHQAEQIKHAAAQQIIDERARFMASVVHDLQQPVYAMSLATESLARRPSAEALQTHLPSMHSALHATDELLSSLSMAVRLDRANLPVHIEDFAVDEMLDRVEQLFAPLAHERGLRWRVTPCWTRVRSDPALLERMVCNLLANAMRYTERGGVLLATRVRRDALLMQVWDTGPGIPEHERHAIFDSHYRGGAARPQDKGLGLGLSIVRRCAQLLDIRVSLRSVPGRGSCFELRVPLAPPESGSNRPGA